MEPEKKTEKKDNNGIRDKKRDMWIRRNIAVDILRNAWNLRQR